MSADVLLEIEGLSKTFPGLKALSDVSMVVRSGEIVAVVGQNGSGKSTLIKILAGIYDADSGGIVRVAGPVGSARPRSEARDRLHFIHQDLGLVGMLSTIENLDIGQRLASRGWKPARRRREARRATELLSEFGIDVDVRAPVSELTAAERTIIAIVRALEGWVTPKSVLVLDEPTAALHGVEVDKLFKAVRRVAERGAGVIFVSHRLDEVLSLADRIAVLRDGRLVADVASGEFDHDGLVRAIAGRDVQNASAPRSRVRGRAILSVRNLRGSRVRGLNLDIDPGEVVGIAGTLGSGREQLAELIFGAVMRDVGSVRVGDQQLPPARPDASIAAGVALVPADRARYGAVMSFSVRENLTLPRLWPLRTRAGRVGLRAERRETNRWISEVGVQPPRPDYELAALSGGNQQKVVLAKWLRTQPRVLLLDEPTQGVDVAAKSVIYKLVAGAAEAGTGVLMCSSETRELVALCHRVLVLRDGHCACELDGASLTEERLVRESLGLPSSASPNLFDPAVRGGSR